MNKKAGWILGNFQNRGVDFMRFIWKVYLTPVLDYCSQLYAPSYGPLLMKLENLLKSFSKKVEGISHLNYWERIKILKLFSVGRRNERYRILYTYKVINGLTPKCGLSTEYNDRTGLLVKTKYLGPYYKNLRTNSFHYIAPRLFNLLPRYLRDNKKSTYQDWKLKLDELLDLVPDNPHTMETIPGRCDYNRNNSPTVLVTTSKVK